MPLDDYDPIFQAAGAEWNVDPTLLKAVAQHESQGVPTLVSPAGATGLMQIMPGTQTDLGVTDPTDPAQSIYGGAKYLSQLLDKYGKPETALAAYDAGPGRVDGVLAGKATLPAETVAYVPAVAANYQNLAKKTAAPAPATQDDTAFLAQTGAAAPSGSIPTMTIRPAPANDADFLAATGAAPNVPPPQAAVPNPIAEGLPDPALTNNPDMPAAAAQRVPMTPAQEAAASNPVGRAIGSAEQGAVEGWQNTEPVLTPAAQNWLDRTGWGGVTRTINGVLGAGNALMSGAANAVAQTGAEAGVPLAGRDLAAMVQNPQALLGTPVPGGGVRVQGPQEAAPSPPSPRFVQEYDGEGLPGNPLASPAQMAAAAVRPNPLASIPATPSFVPPGAPVPLLPRIRQLIDADNAVAQSRPNFVPPSSVTTPEGMVAPVAQPPNPLSVPAPRTVPAGALPAAANESVPLQSVGAAASREGTPPALVDMTPAEVQAYRSTAEGQKLLEPQQPGVADRNAYVPRVTPNAAEIEQTVNTARELKSLNITAPEVSQEAKEVADANNGARVEYLHDTIPSPVDMMNARAAREAQRVKDTEAAWGNKGTADVSPVVQQAQDILNGPDGKIRAVKSAVNQLLDGLKNDDGSFETDPQRIYGVRRDLANDYSKSAVSIDPTKAAGAAALDSLLPITDSVIEKAAPGYRTYMDNYAANSRVIDAMDALQSHEKGLFDSQNRLTYSGFQRMMKNIVDARQSPGINNYKSITDDTMARLWNLRDDLRRSASALELARTPGSDTAQNVWDAAKGVIGGMAGEAALHGGASLALGPLGSPIATIAKRIIGSLSEGRAARQQTARGMALLHPDQSQLRNPLQAP